jgi:purine-binding chemotaxis protein CheW
MDFLRIRKKAKERASARGSAPGAAPPASEPASEAGAGVEGLPVLTDAEVVAGKLAARLQGLPEPRTASAGAVDPRFTTWRPGTGQRPFVATPEAWPASQPDLSDVATHEAARSRRPSWAVVAAGEPAAAADASDAAEPAWHAPPRAAVERDPLDEFFFRPDEEVPALDSFPADAELATAGSPEDAGVEEFLTFRLGVEEYAVAIERVREVLKSQPITEVPRAPAGVLGVVTVRGEVVAVFDPRRRLGLPGAPPPEGSGRIVIVDDGEGPRGLLVDAVASVVRLARGSIEPCPQGIGGASADCLAGIGRERSRLFTVLELGALLRRAPAPPRGGRAAHAGT